MSTSRGRSPPRGHARTRSVEEENSILPTRQLEAFGRTLNATASQLIGVDSGVGQHYQHALGEIHRELRRPMIQRSVFSMARANPREIVRSNFSTTEIQQRALSYVPDELLRNIPETNNSYSLFQGFKASQPEDTQQKKGRHSRHGSRSQKLLADGKGEDPGLSELKTKKHGLDHRLEMMGVRKNMCVSEILELDKKIANLNTMRKLVVERLAGLEQEENDLEHEVTEVEHKLEDMQELLDDAAAMAIKSPALGPVKEVADDESAEAQAMDASFMSESIYEKLPSPKKKRKMPRRVSMPILHEHLEPGSRMREFQAHNDMITALDFDVPFGTMVSAGLDDTLRVWDLNAGRCIGLLEGHLSSVRCLQVEESIVASGSNDATVRLWDLAQADYTPPTSNRIGQQQPEGQDHDREEGEAVDSEEMFSAPADEIASTPPPSSLADCPLYTLSSHVAEVTALHMSGTTLVSGSADKTLRQWDLETGRCVQTLDVLWAAAQASAVNPTFASNTNPASENGSWFRPTSGRQPAAEADFVGALQTFQSAVACGTADSVVRLWDLRSGMVQRSLIGHTGPITALQFDDVHLVTGSADRSIRIWDLRTGSIFDAFAYDSPISSMSFDTRRICAAAGENVVKVYDKATSSSWDCGAGARPLEGEGESAAAPSVVETVRIKDGYLCEGRKDGVVGVWSC